jgi:two-component system nitrogen regulation sensor histidine kinase NtrY
MGSDHYEWKLVGRVVLLLITLSLPVPLILRGWSEVLVFLLPLLAWQVYGLIRLLRRAQQELNQFIESVHYRDFSRHFDEKHAAPELQHLRRGFNEITTTFKRISREKETQYQNLQQIMELVDTGIMSYDLDSGEVLWMNDSLKKLLQIPFMKTVQALAKRDPDLFTAVYELQPGQTKIATAYPRHLDKTTFKVLLSATAFRNDARSYKLVAFQNVNEALDETESQAWQKLLNVMTHEIMNSVAPISSLAGTLQDRLQQAAATGVTAGDVADLEEGISTIKRRSEGLLRFAGTYRNLNRITTLHQTTIFVKDLFTNLERLMGPTLAQKNIVLEHHLSDPHIALQADPNLLDQVLINLLVNAMEAVRERPKPRITLSAWQGAGQKAMIRVTDNGCGMSREVQEKIFIPFFSTRKQGSGIGLSLCKQIVLLHRGAIQVQSVEGQGTSFTLRFE